MTQSGFIARGLSEKGTAKAGSLFWLLLAVTFFAFCAHHGTFFTMPFNGDNTFALAVAAQPIGDIVLGATFPQFPVYRPLAYASLHIQMLLQGIHVPALMLGNLVFVIAAAVTAALIAGRLGAPPLLGIAFGVFIVSSPIWRTALTLIGERQGAMAACFGLIALLLALARRPAAARSSGWLSDLLIASLLLLATLSKELGLAYALGALVALRLGGCSWGRAILVTATPVLLYFALRQWQLGATLLGGRLVEVAGTTNSEALDWARILGTASQNVLRNLVGPLLAPMFDDMDGSYRGILPTWTAPFGYVVSALFLIGLITEPRRALPFVAIIVANAAIIFLEWGAVRNHVPIYLAKYQIALLPIIRLMPMLPTSARAGVWRVVAAVFAAILVYRIVLNSYDYQLQTDFDWALRPADGQEVQPSRYVELEPGLTELVRVMAQRCRGPSRYCVVPRSALP